MTGLQFEVLNPEEAKRHAKGYNTKQFDQLTVIQQIIQTPKGEKWFMGDQVCKTKQQ